MSQPIKILIRNVYFLWFPLILALKLNPNRNKSISTPDSLLATHSRLPPNKFMLNLAA